MRKLNVLRLLRLVRVEVVWVRVSRVIIFRLRFNVITTLGGNVVKHQTGLDHTKNPICSWISGMCIVEHPKAEI